MFEVLDILARDELPSVRAIIADNIRSLSNVPRSIVSLLARDVEVMVSAPILEYSPLLEDDDLIALIANGLKSSQLTAVARRENVGERVSEAIVETNDEKGVATLLENKTSNINQRSYDTISGNAGQFPSWHSSLVNRSDVPSDTIKRISRFIGSALLKQLLVRNDIEGDVKTELAEVMKTRVNEVDVSATDNVDDEARLKAIALFEQKCLDSKAVVGAIEQGDYSFVVHALSLLSDLPADSVKKMFTLKSARTVLAITWKSGLTMDVAMALQRRAAKIPSPKLLHPSKGGAFPLSPHDMEWQLDLL